MTDMIEYIPKRHGQRPPYWTPDTLTGLDGKNYVRQPNWAWIAGTTYYVPYEAVHGVPRLAPVEDGVDPVDPQDIIEALQADNAKLREALRVYAGPMEWSKEPYWGAFPVWADGYPGGVYLDDNTLDFGEAARAALQETER